MWSGTTGTELPRLLREGHEFDAMHEGAGERLTCVRIQLRTASGEPPNMGAAGRTRAQSTLSADLVLTSL